ncbi:hypothetical protein [Halobaculum sp. EA56]|uniref:hypothetical protein n=1 Tax=Halobaculum sp. EA56 TaxID=3421648 RepID=UPI003EB931B4
MTETVSAGTKARTDREGPISDNSSGCAVCGAPAAGVRVAGDYRLPVCEEHALSDPQVGDVVEYHAGIRTRGVVTHRAGDSVWVDGVSEEIITVGQVLAVIDHDGGA